MAGFDCRGMSVLVTGASGFLGRVLCAALTGRGARVVALGHGARPEGRAPAEVMDLTTGDVAGLLDRVASDCVIHCAGLTSAADDATGHARLWAANVTATDRLLLAARGRPTPPRIVLVASAAIWGPMEPGQGRISENHPIRPSGAYGVSKAAAALLGLAAAGRGDLAVPVAVPFNVIGPGQPRRMVPQAFLDRLAAEPGRLTVSDPQTVRDWIDVRDVAAALIALCDPAVGSGLYNVATGTGASLAEIVRAIGRVRGAPIRLVPTEARRASGVARSVGDPARLSAATGWKTRFGVDESLRDMLL